ncbi:MAG TPA: dephospho-CoA kinase [Quisquiliibacterium sp.]|nr:dephospho-CoA kinase [Quisquiliibacterium sp.]
MTTPPKTRPALLVGLTGGIGSGKTTVADLFGELGVPLIDTDLIAHALTGPGGAAMAAIREAFGAGVVATDGRLDRAAMRELAFRDPESRRRLEAILHPMIREETWRQIAEASSRPYAIVVVPLLVESGSWKGWLERVLVVDCPVEVQVERVMRRSGLPREQVEAIIAVQIARDRRLAAADEVIDNSGDPSTLAERVRTIHEGFLKLAAQRAAA